MALFSQESVLGYTAEGGDRGWEHWDIYTSHIPSGKRVWGGRRGREGQRGAYSRQFPLVYAPPQRRTPHSIFHIPKGQGGHRAHLRALLEVMVRTEFDGLFRRWRCYRFLVPERTVT